MKATAPSAFLLLQGFIFYAHGARVKEHMDCPDLFENIHRSCFRFVNEKKNWEEAEAFCTSLSSDLAALEAYQEKVSVNEVIEEKYQEDTLFWFGYRKRPSGGRNSVSSASQHVWEWIPLNQEIQEKIIPWLSSSSKRKPDKYCGGVKFFPVSPQPKQRTLFLDNGKCSQKRFFVCEHKPPKETEEQTTAETAVTSTAWTVVPTTTIKTTTKGTTTTITTTTDTTTTGTTTTPTTTGTTTTPTTTLVSAPRPSNTPEPGIAADSTSRRFRQMTTIGDATVVSGVTPALVITSFAPSTSTSTSPGPAKSRDIHEWPKEPKKPKEPEKPEVIPSEVDDSREDGSHLVTTAGLTSRAGPTAVHATRSPGDGVVTRNTTEGGGDGGTGRGALTMQTRTHSQRTFSTQVHKYSTDDDILGESDTDDDLQPTSYIPSSVVTTAINTTRLYTTATTEVYETTDDDGDDNNDDNDDSNNDEDDISTTPVTTETSPSPTTTRGHRPILRGGRGQDMTDWEAEFQPYRGCYIPGVRASLGTLVMSARRLYTPGREACPEVTVGGVTWPDTEPGDTAEVSCRNGEGSAKFECSEEQVCWEGQPDTADCASSRLKSLLQRARRGNVIISVPGNETKTEQTTGAPPTVQESVELTSQLVQVTAEDDTTMDDVIATSELMTTLTEYSSEDTE
ncbi:hypothetical protein EGW08_005624, partial [Elysia chlorotica]